MAKGKKESFFWTSYSDLMTSMFFVMLVLFVLTISLLHSKMVATEKQLNDIKRLQRSIEKIDPEYFEYSKTYKRHTLKDISVSFRDRSPDINDIPKKDLKRLEEAGQAIVHFMQEAKDSLPDAEYMLIIEGQSSKDNYPFNDELSYNRALSLVRYWEKQGIVFDGLPCELIISGSGYKSRFREQPDIAGNKNNQRFVIHIIPKPGNFDEKKNFFVGYFIDFLLSSQ